ncbi:hypothetical protein [Sandarakinorhabdus sp. DWP1-3-1]|uniref:hypothetical protein n=1 Tax=Sandarakinorhabdus sp. DWP1-3-1 TaxID=2804627 RepID=UPI003CFAB893
MTTRSGVWGGLHWSTAANVGVATAMLVLAALLSAAPAAATLPVAPQSGDAAEAAAPPAPPPPDAPFVPPDNKPATLPSSLADGVAALSQPLPNESWQAAWARRGMSISDIGRAASREPLLLPIAAAGVVMIMLASYLRRRRRRQVGWGVLPERSIRRDRDAP